MADRQKRVGIDIGSQTIKAVELDGDEVREIAVGGQTIRKIVGQPLLRMRELLEEIRSNGVTSVMMGVVGAGGEALAKLIGAKQIHESSALAAACEKFYPDVRTVCEMGRESQKYILFECKDSGRFLIEDSNLGNKCASGSGSFIDHMATRLNFETVEEFAKVAEAEENPVGLSGRCAVFTESDITHLYQKGTPKGRIAAGVHQAIARNYRSAIARGKEFTDKVIFIGGVSENPAAIKYLSQELKLAERLIVPKHNRTLGAIGAAIRADCVVQIDEAIALIEEELRKPLDYPGCEPIKIASAENPTPKSIPTLPTIVERAGLGIDIGSVSTKAALVTEVNGKTVILASHYRRTNGDPLPAVRATLTEIRSQMEEQGLKVEKLVAGTTGSGRYLTADYIGADIVRNEITAQASGAASYAEDVDTIFEIGGQDSKYIRLDGDAIVDFEMNKACAAGTGAFLEKQAEPLGLKLEEFGEVALRNTRPPDLDWTCTVFSESAMVYYQQNNIPIPDLAAGICLASVKNYLHKNVGSRELGKKIAFQGAVAFNRGMVAAFETVLGAQIVVPPYPHITGAVGVARLAYLANPEESKFVGFDEVEKSDYEIGSFECKGCSNRCDVNTFQLRGGPKYFYNDRCEKFSGEHKKNLGAHLPDLFSEREMMMFEACPLEHKEGRQTIGIPRGLMFSEYYPLFATFFQELKFNVVISPTTNKKIVEDSLEVVVGEPCFPFKVAHGHAKYLVDQKVDAIFLPGIFDTEQTNPNLKYAQTCPYLQAAPEVIERAIGIKEKGIQFLSPKLHFQRGHGHLLRQFTALAVKLGKSRLAGRKAFGKGMTALEKFRAQVKVRGEEILKGMKVHETAFVVIGRPYTLWDPAVNMDIAKKIQDLGILAIPQDMLPLENEDISDSWPSSYSKQIQKKLAAARVVRKDVRLRAVVLTYFACGQDAFANPFFKDELNQPCYIMQIDEHTADAGVITRIEAFADTGKQASHNDIMRFRATEVGVSDVANRRVWIPPANESAAILAAVMRGYGINADVLPVSPDPGFSLARKAISEDVCLPALVTTEDMIYRVTQNDFDPHGEAFFQGNANGPCRFGMYSNLQRRILEKLGVPEAEMVTLGIRSAHGGLGLTFAYAAWIGFVAHDLLLKMNLRTRPYERVAGVSDRTFKKFMKELENLIPALCNNLRQKSWRGLFDRETNLGPFVDLLARAAREFDAIARIDESKPLVGLVGEFFVRLNKRANQDVIGKLEAEGAEVWLAPMTEFFGYANYIAKVLSADRLAEKWLNPHEWKEFTSRKMNHNLAMETEHYLFEATRPFLSDYDDISPAEVIELGEDYLNHNFGGEAICSMGKSADFARRGVGGIVSVIPTNCMPGGVVTALSPAFRKDHDNIPFLNLDYNGFVDTSRQMKIVEFMQQVKERWQAIVCTE